MNTLASPQPGQQQRRPQRPLTLASGIALLAAQATVACMAVVTFILYTLTEGNDPTELRLLFVVLFGLPSLALLLAHVIGLALLWHRRRGSRTLALLTGALTTAVAAVAVNEWTPLISAVPVAIGAGAFFLILRPSARRWYATTPSEP